MKYLLDTNIISHAMKYPDGPAATRIGRSRSGELGTSIIVSAELKFGALKVGSKRLQGLIEEVLSDLTVAAWESPCDLAYAKLRTQLEDSGRVIGQNDMLIAAHAITLGATMVTDNERHFARVPELNTENWLRR